MVWSAALRRLLGLTLGAAAVAVSTGSMGTALASGGGGGLSAPSTGPGAASATLTRALDASMRAAGTSSGAEVLDLSTGHLLYSRDADVPRIPASVEKLYTTTTALETFGPVARLTTSVLGVGALHGASWRGTLFLRGGGDPTFGSAAFDHATYGTGATVQGLVAGLHARGIRAVSGAIVADASLFDSEQGTPATGGRPSVYVEGALSALAFDRDWADSDGSVFYAEPALEAGDQLRAALRAGGITVHGETVRTGRTPAGATPLAVVSSPTMAALVALTNTPSDNFFAETLLKDIGARFGAGGTTAAGAEVVRDTIAARFRLHPYLIDGSGLAYRDHTSPAQVISLLSQMAGNSAFTGSLARVGVTGTLAEENRGTYAEGRCTGKTGTLSDVSNVVGYCRAQDGHLLAYAFLMNGVNPYAVHPVQDRMEVDVARYDG